MKNYFVLAACEALEDSCSFVVQVQDDTSASYAYNMAQEEVERRKNLQTATARHKYVIVKFERVE